MPIFDYEHIDPWSKVREHRADNITLLCDFHHRGVTAGRISKSAVRRANGSPVNCEQEFSSPSSIGRLDADNFRVHVADISFEYNIIESIICPVVVLDGAFTLSITREDDQLLLSLALYDSVGNLIFRALRGELQFKTSVWDITIVGTTLTIKSDRHDVAVVLDWQPQNVRLIRANMMGPLRSKFQLLGNQMAFKSELENDAFSIEILKSEFAQACIQLSPITYSLANVNAVGTILSQRHIDDVQHTVEHIDESKYSRVELSYILEDLAQSCMSSAKEIGSTHGLELARTILYRVKNDKRYGAEQVALLQFSIAKSILWEVSIGKPDNISEGLNLFRQALNNPANKYYGGHRATANWMYGMLLKKKGLLSGIEDEVLEGILYIKKGRDFYFEKYKTNPCEPDRLLLERLEGAIENRDDFIRG